MNRKILYVLVSGAVAIAVTIWVMYPSSSSFLSNPSKYKFLYCSKCEKDEKFDAEKYAKGCAKCGTELAPTEESIAVAGKPSSPFTKLFLWVMAELIAVMGAILLLTRRRHSDGEEEFFYFNCPKCKQKIRYREHQVGVQAQCRRCRKAFVYPEGSLEEYVE